MNKSIILTVMRLKNMTRVHPQQIESKCARCGHTVAIYPSGQSVLKAHPGDVEVLCQVCHTPSAAATLAPGADLEPSQTHRKQ